MIRKLFFCLGLASLSPLAFATGSSLVATGGITSFEGTAGGGITPWAMIAGYGSKEEIQGTAALQQLDLGEYQLRTFGAAVGIYDRVELSVQRQNLKVESGIVSNVFNLLTEGAINTAPGTDIEQDIIGLKVKVFGDAIFDQNSPWPQVSVGAQYKKNRDFDTSLALSDGSVPLPDTGVPMLLGATEDSGTDYYVSASKLWLGAAWGNNLLANVTARMTKANTFGLLGFGSASDDDYELEWEGSLAILPSPSTAVGVEWRTQTNRLGGLAEEKTAMDLFIAYFPNKHWSLTAAYVDLGHLPFDQKASGLYLSATVNL
ncbi:DUF3034 family protein [Lacimicrobium alkaliphilum]|uniref:DUF3034 domain-containing protein n=1 Tax=Lacimicrobium alkaliphilum TaxID=1526571 RepID=A0A0U2JJC8_9ALTE|nr:DUF3034 family protein [Lacimicrobium alkaliphilum]ALS99302.1 hypothetical protein AT746_14245 [Lacimicrobium alkaliphilum]